MVVARLLGIHKDSVSLWIRKAWAGGLKALLKGKRGNLNKPSKLTKAQQATLRRLITDKHPEQLKLPFALWTREAVGELIFKRCAIRVAIRTLGTYLRKWGFTPQKPARQAIEQQPQAVQRWLEQDYPALAALAKAENALIYWGDEVGLRSDHQAGRSFSPKGKTPVIAVTGKRFGCNMISALTNQGKLAFSLFEGSFTVPVFLTPVQARGRLFRILKSELKLGSCQQHTMRAQAVFAALCLLAFAVLQTLFGHLPYKALHRVNSQTENPQNPASTILFNPA